MTMERLFVILAITLIHFAVSRAVFAQITINMPKIPKIGKPKQDGNGAGKGIGTTSNSNNGRTEPNLIYGPMRPTGTPQLIRPGQDTQRILEDEGPVELFELDSAYPIQSVL